MSGYSKRSLIEKLGIKPGASLALLAAPDSYAATLGVLPSGARASASLDGRKDFIQFFTTSKAELDRKFPALMRHTVTNGAVWISWPKVASKLPTDLNENVVREIGLRNGMVDVKVCAVDEIWSGLKFVYRLKDREQ